MGTDVYIYTYFVCKQIINANGSNESSEWLVGAELLEASSAGKEGLATL